jgi:hypothetical protein
MNIELPIKQTLNDIVWINPLGIILNNDPGK